MKLHYTFFIWVAILFFVAFFGFSTLPHSGRFNGNFLESLANWDGGHYISIAQNGYKDKFQYAFFPLYPLVIKFLSTLTNDYLYAALLISICSSFLGIYLLYRLVLKDFDRRSLPSKEGKKIAEKTIILLLIFPASFFLLTAYSEGLFLLLSVSTFFFLRKGNLFLATISAALASATRLAGIAVVLGFLVEIWVTHGLKRRNWFVIFAPLGLFIYCWYLGQNMGDPFYFITAENHWLRSVTVPGVGFWEAIKNLQFLDLIFAVFGLGMILRSFRFLPISYGVYAFVSILLPLFTPQLSSMPRFLLSIWPIFILMALVKNKYAIFTYGFLSIMLLGVFSIMFVTGFWVA